MMMILDKKKMLLVSKLFCNYKEGDDKARMTMIQENRNVIGNEIILVITKKETTKGG